MIGIYFSGTGNSKYVLEIFLKKLNEAYKAFAIEDKNIANRMRETEEIVLSYSVQYSNLPKMLSDFIDEYQDLWQGKRVFVIATMGLFSGDGAGMVARKLKKYGAEIVGGLHLKMPNSIADGKALSRLPEKNQELVKQARKKTIYAAECMKNGKPLQEGLGFWCHAAGLFGQRLYFLNKTKHYTDRIKIDEEKCIYCGICVKRCPMENISMNGGTLETAGRCTMCYRCVNVCPAQAITLLGKRVISQGTIKKYLKSG